jgi:hypothetical protein
MAEKIIAVIESPIHPYFSAIILYLLSGGLKDGITTLLLTKNQTRESINSIAPIFFCLSLKNIMALSGKT